MTNEQKGAAKMTLRYEDGNGREIILIVPVKDEGTWEELLPYFKDFLCAMGYVFDNNQDLVMTDA